MKRTAWRVLSLALCLAMTALIAVAQNTTAAKAAPKKPAAQKAKPMADAQPQQWSSITVVRVKPDMVTEWQDLQKKVVNPALKKAGVKERSVFETAVFGESYEYVVITPITSFAQYDEPMSPLRKTLGEDAFRDYQAKSRRCIVSSHTFGDLARLDLSYMGKMMTMTGPPKLAVVNSLSIVPGRAAAFENLVKSDVLPVMKKADVIGYFISQTMFGGDGYGYTSVVFYDSFAEIGKGSPFLRVLGPAGAAAFFAKFAGVVAHQERTIARFNPDLSFSAAQ
ncbi:MAG: hypothetical protein AABN34_23175 [Acidobacteriota bacterium]